MLRWELDESFKTYQYRETIRKTRIMPIIIVIRIKARAGRIIIILIWIRVEIRRSLTRARKWKINIRKLEIKLIIKKLIAG